MKLSFLLLLFLTAQVALYGSDLEALRDVYEHYKDWEGRDRDQVERDFLDWLEANPKSPLKAEIYYRLGSMYSTNLNHHREEGDSELAEHYYRMAWKEFDGKYNSMSFAVLSWLAVGAKDRTDFRLEYLGKETQYCEGGMSAEDVFGIRAIQGVIDGRPVPLEDWERERIGSFHVENLKKEYERLVIFIIEDSTLEELRQIAAMFPQTKAGLRARQAVQEHDVKQTLSVVDSLDLSEVDGLAAPTKGREEIPPVAPPMIDRSGGTDEPKRNSGAVAFWAGILGFFSLVMTLVGFRVYRRRR
ncbi:MAG: hypothetical protein RLY93_00050 [Sumerlaeia bacterium]